MKRLVLRLVAMSAVVLIAGCEDISMLVLEQPAALPGAIVSDHAAAVRRVIIPAVPTVSGSIAAPDIGNIIISVSGLATASGR